MADEELERQRAAISCKDYRPLPGKVHCQHFRDGGVCDRSDYFMCVEWLKANPHLDMRSPELPEPPKDANAQLARRAAERKRARASEPERVIDSQRDEPERARGTNAPLFVLDRRALDDVRGDEPRPLIEHPELLTEAAIAEMAATGMEIDVQFPDRVLTLVPEYTELRDKRAELTYRDARTVAVLSQALSPTATLLRVRPPPLERERESEQDKKGA